MCVAVSTTCSVVGFWRGIVGVHSGCYWHGGFYCGLSRVCCRLDIGVSSGAPRRFQWGRLQGARCRHQWSPL
eukprot:10630811-Lingulodinium_polyedra.AAC.1